MDGCYGCAKSDQEIRDCQILNAKGRMSKKAPPRGSGTSAAKKNKFYPLKDRGEQECPTNVTLGMCFMLM